MAKEIISGILEEIQRNIEIVSRRIEQTAGEVQKNEHGVYKDEIKAHDGRVRLQELAKRLNNLNEIKESVIRVSNTIRAEREKSGKGIQEDKAERSS